MLCVVKTMNNLYVTRANQKTSDLSKKYWKATSSLGMIWGGWKKGKKKKNLRNQKNERENLSILSMDEFT